MGEKDGVKKYFGATDDIEPAGKPVYAFFIIETNSFGIIMATILNIDTAISSASVCLSRDAEVVQLAINPNRQDHASWLHLAIKKMLEDAGLESRDLEAVAVTIGPGSYTGLRVGLAAAKGLCFALKIPLIGISTLELIAQVVRYEEAEFYCPLIDARRMEVFMAVYKKNLEPVVAPCAMIIEENSFDFLLARGKVLFTGNGMKKLEKVVSHPNAVYKNSMATAAQMIQMSENKFGKKKFEDTAYIEPFYIKEFYFPAR